MYDLLADAQNPMREAGNGSRLCQADPSSQDCICETSDILGSLLYLTQIIFPRRIVFLNHELGIMVVINPSFSV